jgi:hypothetical protein
MHSLAHSSNNFNVYGSQSRTNIALLCTFRRVNIHWTWLCCVYQHKSTVHNLTVEKVVPWKLREGMHDKAWLSTSRQRVSVVAPDADCSSRQMRQCVCVSVRAVPSPPTLRRYGQGEWLVGQWQPLGAQVSLHGLGTISYTHRVTPRPSLGQGSEVIRTSFGVSEGRISVIIERALECGWVGWGRGGCRTSECENWMSGGGVAKTDSFGLD